MENWRQEKAEILAYHEWVISNAIGERAKFLRDQVAVVAFWRSSGDLAPVVGMVEETLGKSDLYATMSPQMFRGDRLWIVVLYPPVEVVDGYRLASRKREFLAEVENWFLKKETL